MIPDIIITQKNTQMCRWLGILQEHRVNKHFHFVVMQALAPLLVEGEEKLVQLAASCDNVLVNTAKPGHPRLNNDLQLMKHDLEELTVDMNTTEHTLQNCTDRWQHYQDSHDTFMTKLHDAEEQLTHKPEPVATLEEKQQQLQQFKVPYPNKITTTV